MTPLPRLAVLFALAATVPAQTFVVDASNGPGTDFTSFPAAVAAVPDGSTLRLRAGSYASTAVPKGLTILGESNPSIGMLYFTGLNASQPITMKGVRPAGLFFQACAGRVHLEDCTPWPSGWCVLSVTNCPNLSAVRCTFGGGGPFFVDSNVVCVRCSVPPGQAPGGGLSISGGRTQLVECTVSSLLAGQYPALALAAAIRINGGDLRLLGPGTINGAPAMAIEGFGTVRASTNTTFNGATIPYTGVEEGAVTSTAAPLGGSVTATLLGSGNLIGGLVFGFPQPPNALPGIAEELWINPIGFAISGPLATPLTFWLDVPNDPIFRGMVLGWQGLTFGAAGAVLSNPAWFCVQ